MSDMWCQSIGRSHTLIGLGNELINRGNSVMREIITESVSRETGKELIEYELTDWPEHLIQGKALEGHDFQVPPMRVIHGHR